MARSYYYNDSKLNQYIQPRIKKYYNYTHQKLVEEEINVKNEIEKYSKRLNEINELLRELSNLEKNYQSKKEEINQKLRDEEITEKLKISKEKGMEEPKEPESNSWLKNLSALIISIPACYGLGEDDYWFIFIPVATIVLSVFFHFIFDNNSEYQAYVQRRDLFYDELDKFFKPSKEFKFFVNSVNDE